MKTRVPASIATYFRNNQTGPSPVLALDISEVAKNYGAMSSAMGDALVYYAVKSNPHPLILGMLAGRGCRFDAASIGEIKMCLDAGAAPGDISFGNTIKKSSDIAEAYGLGIRMFAVDSRDELGKVADVSSPDSPAEIFCRILFDGEGAGWPLSKKFGCTPDMAVDVLCDAKDLGVVPLGVSFHVGSQQTDISQYRRAIGMAADVYSSAAKRGARPSVLNVGGGFPARYREDVPDISEYGKAIREAAAELMPWPVQLMLEPGRGLVGNCGAIRAEVVLVSNKGDGGRPWVYLDAGKFNGLAETMEEAIVYELECPDSIGSPTEVVLAGPTCDSADVLYDKKRVTVPAGIKPGDRVIIPCAGAYTMTYSTVGFNGFDPLEVVIVQE